MAGNTWIFDLDDTLISNAYLYSNAMVCLAIKIMEDMRFNPNGAKNIALQDITNEINELKNLKREVKISELSPEDLLYIAKNSDLGLAYEIMKLNYDLDIRSINRAKKNKFSKSRFPKSCLDTYLHYFPNASEKKAWIAYEIGNYAFKGDPEFKEDHLPFKDGAEDVLRFLKSKKDHLILLTKGDIEIQSEKIKHRNLERYFMNNGFKPSIYIVDDKNEFEFMRVLDSEKIPPSKKVYAIGNSFNSDIKPALNSGLSGIYIPERKKDFEKIDNHKDFIILKSISEIKEIYENLAKTEKTQHI